MVRSINAALEQRKKAFDGVGRNQLPVLSSRVFLAPMVDHIMCWKVLMHEVINGSFVGLDCTAYFDMLTHDRLEVRQRDPIYWERAHLAALTIYKGNHGTFLAAFG